MFLQATDKNQVLRKALSSKVSDLTLNLITVMSENGRLKLLPQVVNTFSRIMRNSRGEIDCTVTTAKPLDDANRKELESTLNNFAKGKKLFLSLKVDPTIVGGMIVDFAGEQYIDMSIRSKLNLYSNLIRQPV